MNKLKRMIELYLADDEEASRGYLDYFCDHAPTIFGMDEGGWISLPNSFLYDLRLDDSSLRIYEVQNGETLDNTEIVFHRNLGEQ